MRASPCCNSHAIALRDSARRDLHEPETARERGDERVEPIRLRRPHAVDEEDMKRTSRRRLLADECAHALEGGAVGFRHDWGRQRGAAGEIGDAQAY